MGTSVPPIRTATKAQSKELCCHSLGLDFKTSCYAAPPHPHKSNCKRTNERVQKRAHVPNKKVTSKRTCRTLTLIYKFAKCHTHFRSRSPSCPPAPKKHKKYLSGNCCCCNIFLHTKRCNLAVLFCLRGVLSVHVLHEQIAEQLSRPECTNISRDIRRSPQNSNFKGPKIEDARFSCDQKSLMNGNFSAIQTGKIDSHCGSSLRYTESLR